MKEILNSLISSLYLCPPHSQASYSESWVIRTAPELTFHNCYLLLISRTIRRLLCFINMRHCSISDTIPHGVRGWARIRYATALQPTLPDILVR